MHISASFHSSEVRNYLFITNNFVTHFRLLTSFYEALNITAQLACAKKGMDFFPLWFLFAIVAMNILLVNYQPSNVFAVFK